MKKQTVDVIGIANPIQDLVLELEKLPQSNTNDRMYEYCFQGGGNVATALVMCSRLGLHSAIIGVVGDDRLGHSIVEDFKFNHVNTSRLIIDQGKRSDFCVCIAERRNKGKEFISKAGSCRAIEVADLDEAFIKSAQILHIGGFTPAIKQACEWIHEAGGKVSIDAAYYRPDIYENYSDIDFFIGSETFFNAMRGDMGEEEAMRFIQKQGPEIVIFTFGPEGCRGIYENQYFEMPPFDVDVVDTTGAGDVFHGAFNYAYLQGWDVPRCARFASAASAIKCTRLGGRAGIADLVTVTRFIEEGVIDYSEIDNRVLRYRFGF